MGGETEVAQELFGYAYAVVQQLTRAADAELAALDLTTKQWFLLAVIERWFPDDPPSLTEAAARYGSSRQNVKQIAVQLQHKGYLRLATDPHNRATTRLMPGPRAAELARPAQQQRAARLLATLTDGLSPSQQRRLAALLRTWNDHLHTR